MATRASIFGGVCIALFACGTVHDTPTVSTVERIFAESADAQTRVVELRRRFRQHRTTNEPSEPVLAAARVTGFRAIDARRFEGIFAFDAKRAVSKPASVLLPAFANGPVTLEDDLTKLRVEIALTSAQRIPASTGSGIALHRSAIAGADLLRRVDAEGVEDYAVFETPPEVEQLDYDIDVTFVSSIRLVSNTLELLDVGGVPRLRMAPPYIVDARQKRSAATISVFGCNYETNPDTLRVPVAPGSNHCGVRVQWTNAIYPAMLDPYWSTTGSLATARQEHVATLLNTGKVLVVAGLGYAAIKSAELYDPNSGTFGATGSLSADHGSGSTATLLASGKVLVTGGGDGTYLTTAEVYDPTAGTFTTAGAMTVPRWHHTATLMSTNKVLVAGGETGSALASAELYDPVANAFAATGSMTSKRWLHTSTAINTGKVLIVGGSNDTSNLASAELYNPTAGTFSATGSLITARAQHAAVALANGKVLVANGLLTSAELYDPNAGTFSATGSMVTKRRYLAATPLASGKVMIGGGSDTKSDLSSVEIYDPLAGTFATGPSMATPREYLSLTLMPNGKVLAAAGASNGSYVATAEVLTDATTGVGCATDLDCDSGFCVDAVCCDSSCTGQCQACNVQGHVGTCTPVSGAPRGTRPACAGSAPCGGTCDGTVSAACTYPTLSCGSTCADGTETDSICDGAGHCVQEAPRSCNELICADSSLCKTACASNADCVQGFTCANDGTCVTGAVCVDDHTSKGANNESVDCTPYLCRSGNCTQSCLSVSDCVAPNVCSVTGQCVPPSGSTSGCATGGRDSGDKWIPALMLVALSLRRRRGSR